MPPPHLSLVSAALRPATMTRPLDSTRHALRHDAALDVDDLKQGGPEVAVVKWNCALRSSIAR